MRENKKRGRILGKNGGETRLKESRADGEPRMPPLAAKKKERSQRNQCVNAGAEENVLRKREGRKILLRKKTGEESQWKKKMLPDSVEHVEWDSE